jgi:hypothetical protein
MECYVDAGPIVKVRGVTARDCVHLALAELGSRAQFPVTVHLPIGDENIFIERDDIPRMTLRDLQMAEEEEQQQAHYSFESLDDLRLAQMHCAICRCTDLTPCDGGCYWTQAVNGSVNLCSRCTGAS